MKLKYQQKIGNDIGIAKYRVAVNPIVIDYSNNYINNQANQFSLLSLDVQNDPNLGMYVTSPSFRTTSVDVSDRSDVFQNPYFYQYQLLRDCTNVGNIYVTDLDGSYVPFRLEYAHIFGQSSVVTRMSDLQPLFVETFNNELYDVKENEPCVFDMINLFSGLPFKYIGYCMISGDVSVQPNQFPPSGMISIYAAIKSNANIANAYIWKVGTKYVKWNVVNGNLGIAYSIGSSNGTIGTTIGLQYNSWIRIDCLFNKTDNSGRLTVINPVNQQLASVDIPSIIDDTNEVQIIASDTGVFDFCVFSSVGGSYSILWNKPTYVPRYSKKLYWQPNTAHPAPYRVRLLFYRPFVGYVHYDAMVNGYLVHCRELISLEKLYVASDSGVTDYEIYPEIQRIMLHGYLKEQQPTKLYVYAAKENTLRVKYDQHLQKIVVSNGFFYSDGYGTSGNYFYYMVPEYKSMPFARDHRALIEPQCICSIREPAKIVSANMIQIHPFVVAVDRNNIPYQMVEVEKFWQDNTIGVRYMGSSKANYFTKRGINIYKNGVLLPNAENIRGYDSLNGYIELNQKITADDIITVTYLKRASDFILQYPILNPYVQRSHAMRIYIRPHRQAYNTFYPNDTQFEKLCYRYMDGGQPIGPYYSCLTGKIIPDSSIINDFVLPLADIILTTSKQDEDIRQRGGGITESAQIYYKEWPSFLDIGYGIDGKVLPQSVIFVRIPNNIKARIRSQFFFDNDAAAVRYIKESIEKYIGAGIFYVIVDENNIPWSDPYPTYINDRKLA